MLSSRRSASRAPRVVSQAEERATGSIGLQMYLQYLAAWSPFFLIPAAMFGFAAGERVFTVRAA